VGNHQIGGVRLAAQAQQSRRQTDNLSFHRDQARGLPVMVATGRHDPGFTPKSGTLHFDGRASAPARLCQFRSS
jgi:hypothetical protein